MTTATFLEFPGEYKRPSRPADSDFYPLVPKTLAENLEFRDAICELGNSDPWWAETIWIMCKRDLLFFCNTFLWIQEPRGRSASEFKVFPWITWPIQDWAMTEIEASWAVENILAPKSREVGFTIQVAAIFFWRMFFHDDEQLGMASRNEEKVDKLDDPSSFFGKFDVFVRYLPKFLIGYRGTEWDRGTCRFVHHVNHATCMGYPTTGDMNRGGRNTVFAWDEPASSLKGHDERAFESLVSVTDCLLIWGTLSADDTKAFNRKIDDPDFPGKRLIFPWWHCPPMRAGLYTADEKGQLVKLDPDFNYDPAYPYVLDGAKPGYLRSPWFDAKTKGMTPAAIAREFNIDRSGGRQQVFDQTALKHFREKCPPPVTRGRLVYDGEFDDVKFERDPQGPWKLWFEPTKDGQVPEDIIAAIGGDISGGTGASNSTLPVINRLTRKQVATYAASTQPPKEFAHEAIAACVWFSEVGEDAYFVPESNGGLIGQAFLKEMKRLGYAHYVHRDRKTDEAVDKKKKRLGFWTPHQGPGEILMELFRAVQIGEVEIFDADVFTELGQYVYKDGYPSHPGISDDDEAHTARNHGDRAVGTALAWYGCALRPYKPAPVKAKEPEYGSEAWWKLYEEQQENERQRDDELNFA